ncbi:hypothetical protein BgAZ_304860 [Babesia gibsoni]|uniref:Transmembrane protein n=1 Tax=Babesia gibsoni TaxID=33632 RepID=A0AAD8PD53_BABGI|nr:hypothetical protein BgAZ_304860 [Babesia gibsoni]
MDVDIYFYIAAAVKLTIALSPLILIVSIFVKNKDCNQRTTRGAITGIRVDAFDSDFEDDDDDKKKKA